MYGVLSTEHGVERPQVIVCCFDKLDYWSAILGTRIPELVLQQFGNNVPGHTPARLSFFGNKSLFAALDVMTSM